MRIKAVLEDEPLLANLPLGKNEGRRRHIGGTHTEAQNLPTLIALALSTAVFPAPKNAELWEILSASKGGLLSGVRPLWTDAAHHLYCEHEFAVVVRKKESAPLTMER